ACGWARQKRGRVASADAKCQEVGGDIRPSESSEYRMFRPRRDAPAPSDLWIWVGLDDAPAQNPIAVIEDGRLAGGQGTLRRLKCDLKSAIARGIQNALRGGRR